MRKLVERVKVNRKQKEELEKIVRGQKAEKRMDQRASIILSLAQGNHEKDQGRRVQK